MKQTNLVRLTVSLLVISSLAFANTPEEEKKYPAPTGEDVTDTVFPKRRKPIIVAVIDTGIAEKLNGKKFMCKYGHKDFTGTGLKDTHGHGSHISGLIHQYVTGQILDSGADRNGLEDKAAPYCQVILKYYDPKAKTNNNLTNELKALQHAINIKVDVINFSGGGLEKSIKEEELIKKALAAGIKIVVAAGNEQSDITQRPFYPASLDKRIYVVGNLKRELTRGPSSNYGDGVTTWEYGTKRKSWNASGSVSKNTGTSQATAVKTGKLIREMLSQPNH